MKNCFFNCIPFLCPLSQECFILDKNERYPKPIQCRWPPTKQQALLCSTYLELLLARSGLFQLVMACSGWFHFPQATTSQNVLTCEFTINQLHVDFITKYCKCNYKVEQLKVGQVLQSGATFIRKQGNYYKVVQYIKQMREREGNRLWQLICLETDTLPWEFLRSGSSVEIKRKKKPQPH